MRVFKTKEFARFARREGIGDDALLEAIDRAERGIVDAGIGDGLIKQRVHRPGQGRRGGFRIVIVWRARELSFFVFGFAKKDKTDLTPREYEAYRKIAALLLRHTDESIRRALEAKELVELTRDG
ncbi:MAG: type II toxin-antitoxin system RelE/ParE family toxin [Hyphomicrobiaceae bacterium]